MSSRPLLSELESPASDDVIARRAELRYVERLSRATLDAGERDAVVRADGSYIITGGLGGLGMVVVRWLVARGAGRLILNGRTEPSDESAKRTSPTLATGRRNRLCARRYRVAGSSGAAGGGGRGDRTAIAGSRARGGRDRRRHRGRAHPGRFGAGVGAQGGRRVAAARGDSHPTARLVGWLLFHGFAAGFAGSTGVHDRAMRGSTPWWRGDAHRVYPQPRSAGASGRMSG